LDTTSTLGLALLVISTVLLVVLSAAETAVGAMSRARLHAGNGHNGHGLRSLVEDYIHHRQRVLRGLNAGVSLITVTTTLALVLLIAVPRDFDNLGLAIATGLAVLLIATVRQCARSVALMSPEATGLLFARPIQALQWVLAPIGWVVAAPARAIVRIAGRDPDAVSDPADELMAVLEERGDEDEQSLTEERRMMRGILAMSEQTVREVLSPRIDIAAIPQDASIDDAMRLINQTGFSRIPVYEDSIDHIVGVVYAKDLLAHLHSGARPSLGEVARAPYFVPETKRVDDLLSDMRRDQVHMAIAVDEYGGTAGVVTVEDLLEEIVGEIADEYDVEDLDVQRLSDDEAIVDAGLPIDDLNELFGSEIDSEDFDTVGGLILSLLGRLAVPGDEVQCDDGRLTLRVLSVLGRRIKKVRVTRLAAEESPAAV
jgi:CBS domain containing-hemolysin-like protein